VKEDLDPRRWYGDVISGSLTEMANDYERLAGRLRKLAEQVPLIDLPREGLSTITATGIASEALGEVARWTPRPVGLVRAAGDWERDVHPHQP
jgi:hypothetical protein